MQSCKGCRQQQTNDALCLACIEDLSAWLRSIPDLYAELGSVRLPGSVQSPGPRSYRTARTNGGTPVRLEIVDLLDRGETLRRLWDWCGPADKGLDVRAICDGFRHHLLGIVTEPWAGDFWRAMRSLCRDLGRAVGEPEDRAIGKCSNPTDAGLCRGQLFRTADGAAVYCRRCGDKPALTDAAVWVSLEQAARLIGRPLETVRTWYKRGKLSWDLIGPQPHRAAWLPAAVRLANGAATTLPLRSGIVNHGSGAELSPLGSQVRAAGPPSEKDTSADVAVAADRLVSDS